MSLPTWPSYVINLDANTVRMSNAQAQFAAQGLAFRRIEAVNGWELPEADIERVYDARANAARARHDLVPAEIGCYLSHIDAWRAIAAGAAEGGFIFEDDFEADDTLAPVLAALTEDGGSDWDMVKLFTFDPDARLVSERQLTPEIRLVVPYRVPTCLIGYGLTKAAARKLVADAVPFFRPVDEDQKYFWETGLRVALTLPAPIKVGDQQAVTGTIGKARRDASGGGVKRLWRGLKTQIAYQAALRWHRRRK
ncbi:glycosyltransferase family 25 protein [Gymnodinialimonas ceratoperidinii]|uniref:Glycosyltransferase family 25 protein n=1 Tax=Gymnodinialimonas ceratoperidinii TaxID=2856823 RepID=A0A8F6TYN9_9RHOB|nr:glycosyltransferase family 25 protein [Gymnodinialimonas ceratoperidinii]QXT40394.1 glycosyltransferase family 25 protein [Gymnodinialimonas ceratoperidinii]